MTWLLIVWITGDPGTTGVLTQTDEASCERTAEVWQSISPNHRAFCAYGNLQELNLETYLEDYRDTE